MQTLECYSFSIRENYQRKLLERNGSSLSFHPQGRMLSFKGGSEKLDTVPQVTLMIMFNIMAATLVLIEQNGPSACQTFRTYVTLFCSKFSLNAIGTSKDSVICLCFGVLQLASVRVSISRHSR